tara:strand:- start:2139 stop:2291 length:153 start_codon:yes stop_codon:yes gene_type:complete
MEWLTAALTIGGIVAVLYGLAIAWPPLAFMVGGTIALRVAWSLDSSGRNS